MWSKMLLDSFGDFTLHRRVPGCLEVLPPSQNNCTCWLLRFTFDHSSYLKKLWKYYLFCYYMFYHHIYFKYIIIIFIVQIFWIKRMVKRYYVEAKGCEYFGMKGIGGGRRENWGDHGPRRQCQASKWHDDDRWVVTLCLISPAFKQTHESPDPDLSLNLCSDRKQRSAALP
jgi:hypothetical protein